MTIRSWGAALTTAVVLTTLSACGGGSGEESTETDAAPASGATIKADGFSFSVPKGWEKTDQAGAAMVAALDSTDKDGFADNVNVVSDPTVAKLKGDALAEAIKKSLEQGGVKEVEIRDGIKIDGADSVHVAGLFEVSQGKYGTEQYAVTNDGKGYIITFSHNEDMAADKRDEVDHSILASWNWGG